MAYTTIDDPSAYFYIQLYTGSSSGQSITNDANAGDFKPDWVWIKRRDGDPNVVGNGHHSLYDSSRGVQKEIYSDLNSAEATNSGGLTAFGTDGFTVGTEARVNSNGLSFVSWQWKANGGTTTSVSGTGTTAGSTKAGTYQANTTAGFSIVTFSTGVEDTGDHRIEHGLGVIPNFIITKDRNGSAYTWYLYHHKGTDDIDYLRFDTNPVVASGSGRNVFNGSGFTSTYFEMDHNNILPDSTDLIGYCFAEKQGFSKFGSYTGNGNANGPFVYTGFKPAWVMIKNIQTAGYNWIMQDTKRFGGVNSGATDKNLAANSSSAEPSSGSFAGNQVDFLSNGFKLRSSAANTNAAQSYIYVAFAQNPLVASNNVIALAR